MVRNALISNSCSGQSFFFWAYFVVLMTMFSFTGADEVQGAMEPVGGTHGDEFVLPLMVVWHLHLCFYQCHCLLHEGA